MFGLKTVGVGELGLGIHQKRKWCFDAPWGCNPYSAGISYRRQNLTSEDVFWRQILTSEEVFWRLKLIPAL